MKLNKETGLKKCWRCGRELPSDKFSKDKTRSDGLTAVCKQCNRIPKRKPTPYTEKKRQRQLEYRNRNKDKINKRNRERYRESEETKQKMLAYGKKWRDTYPEKESERHKRYRTKNREALLAREKQRRDNDKRYVRNQFLKNKYGITIEEFETMMEQQDHKCFICGKPLGEKRYGVDHNHTTGKIRAILCVTCNSALGMVDDDTSILEAMINYVKNKGI